MSRALRLVCCLSLLLVSTADGWRAWADEKVYNTRTGRYESQTGDEAQRVAPSVEASGTLANGPAGTLAATVLNDPRLSPDQRQMAADYLRRYGDALNNGDENVRQELSQTAKDLRDPSKDPGLALAHMFERTADVSRRAEAGGQVTQILSQEGGRTKARVVSAVAGKTLFTLETNELDSGSTLKIVRRPDPGSPGGEMIDAIVLQESKGPVTEQRVLYNRRVHDLFRNLKKLYYDQCNLVRRINNGELEIANSGCPQAEGYRDGELTDKARKEMRALYDKNKNLFPDKLLQYLKKLDGLKEANQLDQLKDWKELESMQRLAMGFYQDHQLKEYQRVVMQQLISYFSSATGVQAKQEKGEDAVDRTAKELEKFQEQLDDFKHGDMEGYGWLLSKLGYTKLDETDKKYVTPEVLAFASEAFASVGYAARAQQKLLDPSNLSGPEQDALIEEAGNWLKLAQVQIQTFAMHMQAMELKRLADGRMAGGMGISVDDPKMIERAEKLAETINAKGSYLDQLRDSNARMKSTLLRQAVASYQLTYQNATEAYLYNDTQHERLQLLSGKVAEMLSLYLANEFEKVRNDPEYTKNFSAAEKAQAGAFTYFVEHLPPEVASTRSSLELFKRKLDNLAPLQSMEAIRAALTALQPEFEELAKSITGLSELPKLAQVKEESQKQTTANGRLLAAVQSYSSNAQLFSYLNQLDLYVDTYASSHMVWSKSDSVLTQIGKFKWLDAAYNALTGGYREKGVNALMDSPVSWVVSAKAQEAYRKLKGDTATRDALKQALRDGDFNKVYELSQKLDPEGAERAKKQAALDKLGQSEADTLDLDGLFAKQYNNDAQTGALGAVSSRFKLLQPLMMAYAGASAAVDSGITIVATAVGGPLLAYATDAFGGMKTAAGLMRARAAAYALEDANKMSGTLRGMALRAMAGTLELVSDSYVARMGQNWGRNFRQILDLPPVTEHAATSGKGLIANAVQGGQVTLRQLSPFHSLGSTWKNAASSTLGGVKMLGIIQVGMTEFDYFTTPAGAQHQYSSAWDAAVQGFIQGMAFGAKMSMLNHLSPIPATAFQGRFLGRFGPFMQKLANSAGPASWTVETVARMIPATAKSAIAENGVFGALQKYGMNEAAGGNFMARTLVHGLGQVDGMLKYVWLAGTLPKAITEFGYMLAGDKDWKSGTVGAVVGAVAVGALVGGLAMAGKFFGRAAVLPMALAGGLGGLLLTAHDLPQQNAVDQRTGLTTYMTRLSNAHFVSQNISQMLWILLPTNPAFSPSEMHSQMASAKAYNTLIDAGRAMEIANAPNDFPITVEKPLSKRGLMDWMPWATGTDTLIVNEQWRQQAWGHIMKGFSESELLAIAEAPLKEGAGQIVELKRYLDGMREPDAFKKWLIDNIPQPGAVVHDASVSVELLVGKKWERVDLGAPNAKARWVAGDAPGDGYVEVIHPRTGQWVKVGADAETPVARPVFGGRPDQVRMTIESVAAAKAEFETRLKDKQDLRKLILLTPDSGEVALPGGLRISGDKLAEMRDTAGRVESNDWPLGVGLGELLSRGFKAGFSDGKLDGHMELFGRMLRDDINKETRRLARSKERYGEIAKQAREIAENKGLLLESDRVLFNGVADALKKGEAGRADAERLLSDGIASKVAAGDRAEGIPARTLEIMLKGVKGEQTPDLMRMAAQRAMARKMGAKGAALDAALQSIDRAIDLRKSVTAAEVRDIARRALEKHGAAAPELFERLKTELAGHASAFEDSAPGFTLLETVRRQMGTEALAIDRALFDIQQALGPLKAPTVGDVLAAARTAFKAREAQAPEVFKRLSASLEQDAHGLAAAAPGALLLESVRAHAGEQGAAISGALADIGRESDAAGRKAAMKALTVSDIRELAREALTEQRDQIPAVVDRLLSSLEKDAAASRGGDSGALLDAVKRRVLAEMGSTEVSMSLMRQALEGDAIRQAAAERGLDAAARGDKEGVVESIDLLIDIWERGVFGQLSGQQVLVKDKNGKEELQWTIPKERQFQNRFGVTIPSFRELQRLVLREGLLSVMQGKPLVFGQMPTAGGKTLTMFVAIEFLKAHARRDGREGVILLTANPDLVAQAKDDYLGFFGKKPDFEIMTVGDISAQIAQAKSQGMPSPLMKNHLVIDEADKYAAEVPTSVGVFNGSMTMPKINPILLALQKEMRTFIDGDKGFFKTHYDSKDGHVREGRFQQLMEDETFAKDFRAAVERAQGRVGEAFDYLQSAQFRKDLDRNGLLTEAPEYLVAARGDRDKAIGEIQKTLIAEFKHARGSGEVLYGSFEKDLSLMFQGAYQFASSPERAMVGIADKTVKGGSVISFNNGAAYSNLSTLENRAIASYNGMPIKNPFKTAGVLNYRGLIEEAKKTGAVVFAVSGTSAAPIREVFIREFGFNFIGEVSIADPYKPRLLMPKGDWVDTVGTRKFVHAGLDVKESVIPEYLNFLRRTDDGKVLAKKPAELYAELDKLVAHAAKTAKDPNRVAVVLRPDIEEMFKAYAKDIKGFERPDPAKLERNKAAFEKGDYDELILVGGPNMVFKFAPTLGTGEHLKQVLSKVTKPERISIQTRPGAQLELQERGSVKALGERNQASLETGDAEVTGLIGYAGLRGLEVYLNLYTGRSVRMDILDPQALPTEELTQLLGRLAFGRAGMLRERLFTATVRPEELLKSTSLPRALSDKVNQEGLIDRLRADAHGTGALDAAKKLLQDKDITDIKDTIAKVKESIKQIKDPAEQKKASQRLDAAVAGLTPESIVAAVKNRDAARATWDGVGKDVKIDDPVWKEILLPALKDPNNLNATKLITSISEILKLRGSEGLTDAERAEILKLADLPVDQPLVKFIGDPKILGRQGVLETLIASMGRVEQEAALSTSGIVGNGSGNAVPKDQRLMKPHAPGAPRVPGAPGAPGVTMPGMPMPAPVGP